MLLRVVPSLDPPEVSWLAAGVRRLCSVIQSSAGDNERCPGNAGTCVVFRSGRFAHVGALRG